MSHIKLAIIGETSHEFLINYKIAIKTAITNCFLKVQLPFGNLT